jgi:hypothetical protein
LSSSNGWPRGTWTNAIRDLEICHRRALEATRDDWVRWDKELRPAFEADGFDEPDFSLPADAIEEMSREQRLAYVAGLLRELALYYGLHQCGSGSDRTSPARLWRSLPSAVNAPALPQAACHSRTP